VHNVITTGVGAVTKCPSRMSNAELGR